MHDAVAVVIGVGNTHRRDDGVGPAVAAEVAADCPAGVRVVTCAVEPTAILDAWDGADLAVVIDAAGGDDAVAGRVRRCTIDEVAGPGALTSHDLTSCRPTSWPAFWVAPRGGSSSSVSTPPTSGTARA